MSSDDRDFEFGGMAAMADPGDAAMGGAGGSVNGSSEECEVSMPGGGREDWRKAPRAGARRPGAVGARSGPGPTPGCMLEPMETPGEGCMLEPVTRGEGCMLEPMDRRSTGSTCGCAAD